MTGQLLSIDVNAHLEKLATHTYRSPSHYPVELVRSALGRGAETVDVLTDRKRFEIRDNGRALDPEPLRQLRALLDNSASDREREEAILNLQDPDGIGLLAIFSPSPVRIELVTTGPGGEHRLLFDRGAIQRFEHQPENRGKTGTRITLTRRGLYVDQEEQILKEYCRGVSRKIRVNHHLVSGRSLIRHAMVSLRLDPRSGGIAGEVGIPLRGDACRIWFLNQGIPLDRKIIAPWKGFIFDAALELSGEITGKILNGMLGDLTALYRHLIEKFRKFPPQVQRRIEELVFKHFQLSRSRLLIDHLPVFYSQNERTFTTLPRILELAENQVITVIPDRDSPSDQVIPDGPVFRLSDIQTDLLANQMNIPIQFPQPAPSRRRVRNWFFECRETLKDRLEQILPGRHRPVPLENLTPGERHFLTVLKGHLNGKSPNQRSPEPMPEIIFVESRRFSPFLTVETPSSMFNHRKTLRIHRRHPLVKKIIRAVEMDSRNIEMADPLFD